jgi:hypothetical protein
VFLFKGLWIVDSEMRFLDVLSGWPGSVQDTRLLKVSSFYKDAFRDRTKLNGMAYYCSDNINIIREYILGDAGYPLHPWLITPFSRNPSPEQEEWNYHHSQCRMVIERAFGRLKGVWRILNSKLYMPQRERISPLIYTCCLLHNLVINRQEVFNDVLFQDVTGHPPGYEGVAGASRETHEGGGKL